MNRKPNRPKGLSKADRDLWDHVTRNVDREASNRFTGFEVTATTKVQKTIMVAPKSKAAAEPTQLEELAKAMGTRPETAKARNTNQTKTSPSERQNVAGLDRRNSERLRKGQMEIEARLDLHGLRQGEAHHRLRTFLSAAQIQGKRCVLVITGKGSRADKSDDAAFMTSERSGILRNAVPNWLSQPDMRRLVIDYRHAQPRHGGSGALYILLRRLRG
jgi:DNA-nicking Smr family endonuclease